MMCCAIFSFSSLFRFFLLVAFSLPIRLLICVAQEEPFLITRPVEDGIEYEGNDRFEGYCKGKSTLKRFLLEAKRLQRFFL